MTLAIRISIVVLQKQTPCLLQIHYSFGVELLRLKTIFKRVFSLKITNFATSKRHHSLILKEQLKHHDSLHSRKAQCG